MKAEINSVQGTLIVKLEGDIDHHGANEIREPIDKAMMKKKPKKTILDFQLVPFCDSSGIAVVVGRYKLAAQMGGKIEVINTCSQVQKVLKIAGLEKLVKIN